MPFNRLSRVLTVALLAALAACSKPAPAPVPQESPAAPPVQVAVKGPERHILAFGDSLFAGYGLADPQLSYPAQLEAALRAKGINARVANAGVSGDTSAAGRQRLAFTLDQQQVKPDLVILELGGNDMLRSLPPKETRANLKAMLEELRKRGIPVLIMGMRAPPNYGPEFQTEFDGIYPALAKEYGAALVPFFLEAIYREPTMFQADRIHPTANAIGLVVTDTLDKVTAALPQE